MNPTPEPSRAVRRVWITLACALHAGLLQAATSCLINGSALTFPNYDPSSASPTDGVGSVELSCTNLDPSTSVATSLTLGLGSSANGLSSDRKMAGNASLLRYGVYGDSARTQNWDETHGPAQKIGPLQAHETKRANFTLYGRIPALQNVRAGTYSDTVLVTVTP